MATDSSKKTIFAAMGANLAIAFQYISDQKEPNKTLVETAIYRVSKTQNCCQ
ncbi:MAG: hypothetical protein HWQ38_11135 [Nostoc sp. NMS7]|uniref:hypothetical protein n=1 Tax=Nostoc sp. NMS7 TaxID=2815391 RepID=UPI0025D2DD8F|nr:hypothetical protein [Nostoc sp. NMS7]MBN3947005.1 hypothetical protein [Nostoc sp. NMS7]